MEDVVALCPRVVVIDKGRLIYDGDLRALSHQLRPDKRIVVRFGDGGPADGADLTVEDPPLEEVMKELFARSREEREAGAGGADVAS